MLSILPIASVVGRLAGGFMLEQLPILSFTLTMIVLQALSLFLVAVSESPLTLGLSLALFGLSVGNLLMLQPLIVADRFGLLDYSRLFLGPICSASLGLQGPGVLGAIYGAVGNFAVPYFCVRHGSCRSGSFLGMSPLSQYSVTPPE